MFSDELLHRLAVALGIGLLIGLERGWRARDEGEGERAAGFRTFALSGLLGGICAALVPLAGALVLAAGLL
ncbi:MgtC/SapB family protein, partial [Geminicoccus harenae]